MMQFVEPSIEETVDLNCDYPRVSERYFTEYFYVPSEKHKLEDRTKSEVSSAESNESVKKLSLDSVACDDKGSKDSFEHTCVLVHSNKLCLLSISHYHPIITGKKEVTKISFDVGKFNRLENQVSGKSKRGAQMFGPRSAVCIITCSDDSKYTVLSGVTGKLIEVNERLIADPQLLTRSPKEDGYLAIVLPPLHNGDKAVSSLLSREQYENLINSVVSS
ncbi:hypothetical protein SK128_014248 [Halocaridina rubra]|uniref:Protein Abitram n=1 Tax=Halocaridina rubra TaxID=373956 RepID=A0AAN8X752_HALRR